MTGTDVAGATLLALVIVLGALGIRLWWETRGNRRPGRIRCAIAGHPVDWTATPDLAPGEVKAWVRTCPRCGSTVRSTVLRLTGEGHDGGR